MLEIPNYGLRSYALFFSKYGTKEAFKQSELDWIVSPNMRKKIFSVLLNSGWIRKISRMEYRCASPETIFKHLLDFKLPEMIKQANRPYAFTGLSAVEIWSDFSYILRGRERSPYFIKVLKKDLIFWKRFFSPYNIPIYIKKGSTVGEFVVLLPTTKISAIKKKDLFVEPIKNTLEIAKENKMFIPMYKYIKKRYGKERNKKMDHTNFKRHKTSA